MAARHRNPFRSMFPDLDIPGIPELPYFSFDLQETLERAHGRVQQHFPEADLDGVGVWVVEQDTLARIWVAEKAIFLHAILNHHQTPEPVIEFILCHELLHMVIPPREVDGKRKSHPPEFAEMQRKIYPRAGLVWAWLHLTMHERLKRDKEKECTFVKRGWKKDLQKPRLPMDEFIERFVPKHLLAQMESECILD